MSAKDLFELSGFQRVCFKLEFPVRMALIMGGVDLTEFTADNDDEVDTATCGDDKRLIE